jgi:hypothetical protein
MTTKEYVLAEAERLEAAGKLRFVPKDQSWLMRQIGRLWPQFITVWWTTLRVPFRPAVIYHPPKQRRGTHWKTIWHELRHVEQFEPWYGPLWMAFLFVAPPFVLFSGRWFIERSAYLRDVLLGTRSPENAASTLWRYYGWPWPPALMRAWFHKHLEESRKRYTN